MNVIQLNDNKKSFLKYYTYINMILIFYNKEL